MKSAFKQIQALQKEILQKNELLKELAYKNSQLLKDKEWLLKEMHHRVKNNLQVVMSLLSTQSFYLKNDTALKAIQKTQQRMFAISLLHINLYESEIIARLNIRHYIYELVENLKDSFSLDSRIRFNIEVDNIQLDTAQGAPLGLILNESISNAIEYAYPGQFMGEISIQMIYLTDKNHYLLTIADDGVGLPANFDIDQSESSGLRLISGLTKQMGGNFTMTKNPGVKIAIDFTDLKSGKDGQQLP